MIKEYIMNLVNQKIPMPNVWTDSMGLRIEKSKQLESDFEYNTKEVKAERTGYMLFDKLTRGYISHKPKAFEYSGDTHYLLGMYLRALKEKEGLDYMPFYNCVNRFFQTSQKRTSYAPIILNKFYFIYADQTLPVSIKIRLSHTGEILASYTEYISSDLPFILSDNWLDNQTMYKNVVEYIELEIETLPNVYVTVLEADSRTAYKTSFKGNLENGHFTATYTDSSGELKAFLLPKLSKAMTVEFWPSDPGALTDDMSRNEHRVLFKRQNMYWSNKLIECLLGTSVTKKSLPEVKRDFIASVGGGKTVEEVCLKKTLGIYDINGNSDRRIKL